jgi:hypothetical protein
VMTPPECWLKTGVPIDPQTCFFGFNHFKPHPCINSSIFLINIYTCINYKSIKMDNWYIYIYIYNIYIYYRILLNFMSKSLISMATRPQAFAWQRWLLRWLEAAVTFLWRRCAELGMAMVLRQRTQRFR